MATILHPITGLELNAIEIRRKSLTEDDAVTAIILRQQGVEYHLIAQQLGTNTHRLGEVFRGEVHSAAALRAMTLLAAGGHSGSGSPPAH